MESKPRCQTCWHFDDYSLAGTTCFFNFPEQITAKHWCKHYINEPGLSEPIHFDEVCWKPK